MEGHEVKGLSIPDYIDPKFAREKHLYDDEEEIGYKKQMIQEKKIKEKKMKISQKMIKKIKRSILKKKKKIKRKSKEGEKER